jgi:hypothetical protein
VFDWAAIIPQYQALWAEQNARRLAAPPARATRDNPFRPDPFTLFQSYPTRHLSPNSRLSLAPGITWEIAEQRLSHPLAAYSNFHRPTLQEARHVLAILAERQALADPALQSPTVTEVALFAEPARRPFVTRGVLWLARYGLITIAPED